MQEIWKDIRGYEGLYQVSNLGRVKSLERTIVIQCKNGAHIRHIQGFILKPELCKSTKYLYVNLNKYGKPKHCTVHKLVAEAFIPNPDNLPQINHLDEQRQNNQVDNLEWCTNKHNCNYGSHNINMSKIKKIQNKGKNNPFYGKHHSERVRKRVSEAQKGRIRITNGIDNKSVYPEELQKYLDMGYKKGLTRRTKNDKQ